MRIPAYAKINLYLDVMEKTPDGFHNIKSIMHSVSLCDYVTAERKESSGRNITVTCTAGQVPTGSDNIVWKAANAFFDRFGLNSYDVSFHIEKNIPMAAGLAGGSTDAGAALVLLNELYGIGADKDTLLGLGAEIGSDVPFCMLGGTALATGRGEKLEVMPSKLDLTLVIAKGGDGVSTPLAYKMIDEKFGDALSNDFSDIGTVINAVEQGRVDMLKAGLYNTFESVVLPDHEEAKRAKEQMLDGGAVCAMLSGSGPSVFGVFDSIEKAQALCDLLCYEGYEAYVCKSANESIL